MKLLYSLTTLILAAVVSAVPAEELQKRAICTNRFGVRYFCTSTTTSTPTSTRTTSPGTATPTGGSSTGGASKYTTGSTASDVTDGNGCTPLTVIFARGTGESGNIGSVIGQPMYKQLLADLGARSLTLQGVNYPASSAGNANCGTSGGSEMASLVTQALQACPNTKIVLSGYSQGACVVHNAASRLNAADIDAAVLFGMISRRDSNLSMLMSSR